MNGCCFFTHHSFSLAPFFLPSRFLKYLITKLPPLPKSIQSIVKPFFNSSPNHLTQMQILQGSAWNLLSLVTMKEYVHLNSRYGPGRPPWKALRELGLQTWVLGGTWSEIIKLHKNTHHPQNRSCLPKEVSWYVNLSYNKVPQIQNAQCSSALVILIK